MSTTALSTGTATVNLQVFTGQNNYNRWVRDFKVFAKAEGVWGFYEGTADILTKPDRDDYGIPRTKKKHDAENAEIASASTNATAQSIDLLEANVLLYEHDMEEWEDNDKKVRLAQMLLFQWVDPVIWGRQEGYDDPKDAWDYLKRQYKMPSASALIIARNKLRRLRRGDFQTTRDYLKAYELLKRDISEAKRDV